MAVDRDARVRVVGGEQALDRRLHELHRGVVERALRVAGRVPGREQERVALAQRHVEVVREGEDELGARLRPAGLDEAQVTGRHPDVEGEVHLAAPPPGPPLPHQLTHARSGHAPSPRPANLRAGGKEHDYLRGHGSAGHGSAGHGRARRPDLLPDAAPVEGHEARRDHGVAGLADRVVHGLVAQARSRPARRRAPRRPAAGRRTPGPGPSGRGGRG